MDGYLQTLGEEGTKYWKISRNLGIGLAALSAGVEGANYITYLKQYGYDWNVTAKVGLDLIMSAVGFFGPVGLAISSAYFVLDVATDGFGGFGKMY